MTKNRGVARNIVQDPRLVPGGGAIEMAVSQALVEKSKLVEGVEQLPYRAVANALEVRTLTMIQSVTMWDINLLMQVIPRTLIQNCGASVIRLLTDLRAKHASAPQENRAWGIDGNKGVLVDMNTLGIWEPYPLCVADSLCFGLILGRYAVKAQTFKTAIEAACILLRVDDVVSGIAKKKESSHGPGPQAQPEMDG